MKLFIAIVFSAIMLLSVSTPHAATLTFDDLLDIVPVNGPLPVGEISDYGGLTWENMNYTDPIEFNQRLDNIGNSGFENGMVSSNHVAFNSADTTGIISSDSLIDFEGCYLTGAWRDGLNITVEGYKEGSLLYTSTVVVDSTMPNWFSFNYLGIDTLTLYSFGGDPHGYAAGDSSYSMILDGSSFVMDNFTFENTPVPEPATIIMLLTGLLGIGRIAGGRNRRGPDL